ncbi:predicted protein [Haematococcus lacustris]|uniref:Uncharacterized protein n=1 Tax=Haematococcus lacustris TaxID=44745 RepID=A0A6A0ADM4_HAELA|nr:predicted protein [Haematococcus lacustris]
MTSRLAWDSYAELLPGYHAALLDGYTCNGALKLKDVADDGYFMQAVAHHLVHANRLELLHGLLCEPLWLEAKLHAYGIAPYAAALGSVVTAIDNDLSKKEEAKTLGADDVSANLDTGKLLAMLRNDGTLVQDVVFGQKKVAGSIVGGRADMHVNEALARMHSGKAKYRVVLTMDNCEPALTNGAS